MSDNEKEMCTMSNIKRYKEGASKHNTLLRCNVSQDCDTLHRNKVLCFDAPSLYLLIFDIRILT